MIEVSLSLIRRDVSKYIAENTFSLGHGTDSIFYCKKKFESQNHMSAPCDSNKALQEQGRGQGWFPVYVGGQHDNTQPDSLVIVLLHGGVTVRAPLYHRVLAVSAGVRSLLGGIWFRQKVTLPHSATDKHYIHIQSELQIRSIS